MHTKLCANFAFVINSAAGHYWDDPFTDEHLCCGFQCLYYEICKKYTSLRHTSPCLNSFSGHSSFTTQSSTTDPPIPLLPENEHISTSSLLYNLTITHTFTYHPSTTSPFVAPTRTTHNLSIITTSKTHSLITTTSTAHSLCHKFIPW